MRTLSEDEIAREVLLLVSRRNIPLGTYCEVTPLLDLSRPLWSVGKVLESVISYIEDYPFEHRLIEGVPALLTNQLDRFSVGVSIQRFDLTDKVSVFICIHVGS